MIMSLQKLPTPTLLLRASRLAVRHNNFVAPLSLTIATSQIRPQSTTKPTLEFKTPAEGLDHLKQQRLKRPTAPHLTIWKWEINAVSSAMERITGMMLGGGFYLFSTTYLAAPFLGWDFSTASIAASFGALPLAAKVGAKFCMAWPFTFHLFTGVRYLVSAFAKTLNNKRQIARIGWAVTGASAASALGLALW